WWKRFRETSQGRSMFKTYEGPQISLEIKDIHLNMEIFKVFSNERRNSFLRSDSDSNTYNAFSTPSTLCSESERKNERPIEPQSTQRSQSEASNDGVFKRFKLCELRELCGEKVFGGCYEL